MSRDKIAARQFLSLDCLAIDLTAGEILKEERSLLLWARDSFGGILGEGNCKDIVNFFDEMSRKALSVLISIGVSQTCLGANVLSGLVPSTFF